MKNLRLFRLFVVACALVFSTVANYASAAAADVFEGNGWWWSGAQQSGTGFFVETQGDKSFIAFFLYDDAGNPTWYSSTGAIGPTGAGLTFAFTGDLQTCRGGQPAASNIPAAPSCTNVGGVSITFPTPTEAVVSLPQRVMFAERFNFNGIGGATTGNQPETGWYWNPAQNGRGYAMEVQNGVMFLTMFHYAADGRPTWNTFSGSVGANGSFSGDFNSAAGGQTLSSVYRPPSATTATPGFSGRFASACGGTLTFPGNATPSSVNRFGFALSDTAACVSTQRDPTSQIAFKNVAYGSSIDASLAAFNEQGKLGYAFLATTMETTSPGQFFPPRGSFVSTDLFVKAEAAATYEYAAEEVTKSAPPTQEFLADMLTQRGRSGFLYRGILKYTFATPGLVDSYYLFVKNTRRPTTYSYRLVQSVTGVELNVSEIIQHGREGYSYRGLFSTATGIVSLYAKDDSSSATYSFLTRDVPSSVDAKLATMNSLGADFYAWKGRYAITTGTVDLYERASTTQTPIQYEAAEFRPTESSMLLTRARGNTFAKRGKLYIGDFALTTGPQLTTLLYKGPVPVLHPLFGVLP
jgi:hypothetical protein